MPKVAEAQIAERGQKMRQKKRERETEGDRQTHTQRVNNSQISKVYDDVNAPQTEELVFKLDRLLFLETIGHKMH